MGKEEQPMSPVELIDAPDRLEASATATTKERIDSEGWHALLFGVRRSVRYHMRRVRFFDQLNLVANALSLLFSSATILAVVVAQNSQWAIGIAALVTVTSTLNLLFQSTYRAREHNDLAKRFIALGKKMETVHWPTKNNITTYRAERLDIETDEPPVLRVLEVLCHNEQARGDGYDEFVHVAWYQRLFAHFFDIGADRLSPNKPSDYQHYGHALAENERKWHTH